MMWAVISVNLISSYLAKVFALAENNVRSMIIKRLMPRLATNLNDKWGRTTRIIMVTSEFESLILDWELIWLSLKHFFKIAIFSKLVYECFIFSVQKNYLFNKKKNLIIYHTISTCYLIKLNFRLCWFHIKSFIF